MASTLGVLDVLSRLREESERASTALAAQEGTNRGLLQRCTGAELESGRSEVIFKELEKQKAQLEEGRSLAESRRQGAESSLRRLGDQHARREEAATEKLEKARAAADSAVESSKKFRADASRRVQQIGELTARLREKRLGLERIRKEAIETKEEVEAKTAARDKVKAEVVSAREVIATALVKAEEVDRENTLMLARTRSVEEEIDEVRQAQEEMQEMAVGLQKKNAVLRNELRHLRRALDRKSPENDLSASYRRGPYRRPASANKPREESRDEGGSKGHYYHHNAAPAADKGSNEALNGSQLASSPYRCPYKRLRSGGRKNNASVRAPFSTAASAMAMPELRLSSPHPGGRAVSSKRNSTFPGRRGEHAGGDSGQQWRGGRGADDDGTAVQGRGSRDENSDAHDTFEYHV